MFVLFFLLAADAFFAGYCFDAGKNDPVFTFFGIVFTILGGGILGLILYKWRKSAIPPK